MAHTEVKAGGWCADIYLAVANATGAIVASPAPWKSAEEVCYQLDNLTVYTDVITENGLGTNWLTASFHLRLHDITSDSSYSIVRAYAGGGQSWRADVINSSGDVRFYNSAGGTIGTISGAVTVNTWYRCTVKWKNTDSAAFRVWWSPAASEHGSPDIDASGIDCYSGSSTDNVILRYYNDSNIATSTSVYCGSWLLRSDSGANIDTNNTVPRPFWCRRYQWDKTGTAPDWGSTLNSGSWENQNELPYNESNYGRYSGTGSAEGGVSCDDASDGGPNGDGNVGDGDILWAFWVWRFWAAVTVKKLDFADWYGVFGAAASAGDPGNNTPVQEGLSAFQSYIVRSKSGETGFPTTSQYMQIGWGREESPDATCNVDTAEMYTGIVYEEPASAVARRVCLDGLVIEVT